MKCFAALLLLAIASCSQVVAAPVLAAPAVLPFNVRELDCLSEQTRETMVRGMLRAEDAISRCRIDRAKESRDYQIKLGNKDEELAGLRVQANMFKLTLGVAVVVGIVAVVTTVFAAVKQ